MCVGAPWPRAPRSVLLFLGLVLGAAAQLECPEHSYPQGNRCCHECQPGERPGRGAGTGVRPWGDRDAQLGWRVWVLRDKWAQGDRVGDTPGLWVTWSQASRSLSTRPRRFRDGEPLLGPPGHRVPPVQVRLLQRVPELRQVQALHPVQPA